MKQLAQNTQQVSERAMLGLRQSDSKSVADICQATWEALVLYSDSPSLCKGSPNSSVCKESVYNAGNLGLIPGLGRSPGKGKGYPLQYSGLRSPWGRKESDTTELLSLHFLSKKVRFTPTCEGKTRAYVGPALHVLTGATRFMSHMV